MSEIRILLTREYLILYKVTSKKESSGNFVKTVIEWLIKNKAQQTLGLKPNKPNYIVIKPCTLKYYKYEVKSFCFMISILCISKYLSFSLL